MEATVLTLLRERLAAGRRAALATLVRTWGSTPQRVGAQALFTPEGAVLGTIGGGCLEHEARGHGLDALRDGRARLLDVALDSEDGEQGAVCGGRALVFIEVPGPELSPLLELVAEALSARRAAAFATVISGSPERLGIHAVAVEEGEIAGDTALGRVAAEALRQREGGLVEVEEGRVFVDLLLPPQRLWIAGAGHVGRALARHAAAAGFEVRVIDDRPDLNNPERLPEAVAHLVGEIDTELAARSYGPEDYIVVVTRGHSHDLEALRAVVRSGAGYVGMIGSRRKIKLTYETLLAEGSAGAADLARVYAPIGYDIGAVTVDEIAIAITAELIAVRRGVLTSPGDRLERPKRRKA